MSSLGPREIWSSVSSVIGGKSTGDTLTQIQDGKTILCEPKAIASKFNNFFATIGSKISSRLRAVATDAWLKYEPENQSELNPLDLQPVNHGIVRTILNSLKVNKAGLVWIKSRRQL